VFCLLAIDSFSKYLWGKILPSKRAEGVEAFLADLFAKEGTPEKLQADNGGEFVNELVENLLDKHSRPHNPKAQGQIERPNGDVKPRLKQAIKEGKGEDLEQVLQNILRCKNNQRHNTTKQIPFEMLRGRLANRRASQCQKGRNHISRAVDSGEACRDHTRSWPS
jgi:hypothetical protein